MIVMNGIVKEFKCRVILQSNLINEVNWGGWDAQLSLGFFPQMLDMNSSELISLTSGSSYLGGYNVIFTYFGSSHLVRNNSPSSSRKAVQPTIV